MNPKGRGHVGRKSARGKQIRTADLWNLSRHQSTDLLNLARCRFSLFHELDQSLASQVLSCEAETNQVRSEITISELVVPMRGRLLAASLENGLT